MRELCFVDVDGVLADLHGPLAHLFGRDVKDWPRGEDDVGRAFQRMPLVVPDAEHDLVVRELGRALTQRHRDACVWGHPEVNDARFWDALPVLQWAAELLARLDAHFGSERVILLTCPTRGPGSYAGKAAWIARHCPGRGHLVGGAKSACAGPGRHLVDDRTGEVEAWIAAGGNRPLLLPRPWNGQAGEPLDALEAWLAGHARATLGTT